MDFAYRYRGKALLVREGGSATLEVRRVNVAERLYRVTGGGIYADSLLVGGPVPLRRPALNGHFQDRHSVDLGAEERLELLAGLRVDLAHQRAIETRKAAQASRLQAADKWHADKSKEGSR